MLQIYFYFLTSSNGPRICCAAGQQCSHTLVLRFGACCLQNCASLMCSLQRRGWHIAGRGTAVRLAAVAGVHSACATGACTGNVTLAEVRQCSSCRNATAAWQHAWRLCIAEVRNMPGMCGAFVASEPASEGERFLLLADDGCASFRTQLKAAQLHDFVAAHWLSASLVWYACTRTHTCRARGHLGIDIGSKDSSCLHAGWYIRTACFVDY